MTSTSQQVPPGYWLNPKTGYLEKKQSPIIPVIGFWLSRYSSY